MAKIFSTTTTVSALALLSMGCLSGTASAEDLFTSVFKDGSPKFDVRYRFEDVDEDGTRDTYANTIRTRLGWETGEYMGVSGVIGFSNVTIIGDQRFNSGGGTSPEKSDRAIIADPAGTVVHEAYLNFNNFTKTNIKLGRQHILLDNLRFVGDVAHRQNNQTMDAVTLTNTYLKDVRFFYSYVDNVNRIWGDDATAPFSNNNNYTHLVNVKYSGLDFFNLTGYYYNIKNTDVTSFSTETIGVRANGTVPLNAAWDVLYDFEYAHQKDDHNNPVDFSEDYSGLHLGVQYDKKYTLKVSREDLGGDASVTSAAASKAFRTPLATLHKWQGWADKFLTTPNAGIEDVYVTVAAKFNMYGPLKFKAVYHDFEASDGGADIGDELDLMLSKEFCNHWGVSLKYADFDGKTLTDTKKFWVTGTYKL